MSTPSTEVDPEASGGRRAAWGDGWATVSGDGQVLDTWYPTPSLGSPDEGTSQSTGARPGAGLSDAGGTQSVRGVRSEHVRTVIDLDAPPADVADAYLRLHLLSHRLVRPHGVDLTGLFGLLPNVAWTNLGPVAVDDVERVRLAVRSRGGWLEVRSVDRFPRMTDYVVPSGVRIADADRVRLGAHLASGTVVMHEGFVNFNAGTLGTSMVEGRISSGVVVGDGSDIGGGSSIMGTLSGGGKQVISVGKGCLLGANAGIGISLGDGCVVEAGVYVTASQKVALANGKSVKALELSGEPGLLFRRNSITGALEALRRSGDWGSLNPALHAH